jgi:hypothetical protein
MPLILGANSVSGGYEVDNSLRFNTASSDYLSKTFGSNGSLTTWTLSFWVKRSSLSVSQSTFSSEVDGDNTDLMYFQSSDKFDWWEYTTGYNARKVTNQLFRDVSAWYHIVCVWDTTNATSSDRQKIYVNGERITSFSSNTEPALNETSRFNSTVAFEIGRSSSGSSGYFGGYISEINFIDGQALTPTSFGETDEDTNIWKPKAYTGTYGTNGFYLQFKNSASLGTDSSGNGNTFTVNNLTSNDQTTDTPTNNFATWNSLHSSSGGSYNGSFGNTQVIGTDDANTRVGCTFGVSKGKYYWEVKQLGSVSWGGSWLGIIDVDTTNINGSTLFLGNSTGNMGIRANNNWFARGNAQGESASAIASPASVGDIVMFALDMDNNFLYAGLNGTWLNSGVPTSGATGTGNINNNTVGGTSYSFILTGKTIMPAINVQATDYFSGNFGNPSFTISSGNADANGYGNFEYAVPSGYYSLNTKNLATFG